MTLCRKYVTVLKDFTDSDDWSDIMSSKKDLREYAEKYGNIPRSYRERIAFIMESLRVKAKDMDIIGKGIRKLLNIHWSRTNFIFYLMPKATPRARRSGKTGVFYVKNASNNSQLFKDFIDNHGQELGIVSTPCKLLVDLYLPMPSGMSTKEKIWAELKLLFPVVKPDWDNAGKTYSDMIQRYYLLEDSLVIDGRVRKFYSFLPRIEVTVEYMTQYDCKFNKRKIEEWKTYKEAYMEIEEKESIV